MKQKQSIYERVTATILAQIEAGPGQAAMPWHRRAIFKCAADASRATDYLFAFSENAAADADGDEQDGDLEIAA